MGETAFDDVAGECQRKVTTCRITRYDDVLRQEPSLTDKILVCRDCIYECGREQVLRF